VPPTTTVTSPPHGPVALEGNGSRPTGSRPRNRSYVSRVEAIDRLEKLRSVLPVFAQELVSARRQSAQLRAENGWLLEQVRHLQRGRAQRNPSGFAPTS
jgi:hypothetical protein